MAERYYECEFIEKCSDTKRLQEYAAGRGGIVYYDEVCFDWRA